MLLVRGDHTIHKSAGFSSHYNHDHSLEGYGYYAYDASKAHESLVYALNHSTASADDDVIVREQGILTYLSAQLPEGSRSLNECLIDEAPELTVQLFDELKRQHPNTSAYSNNSSASHWETSEDLVGKLCDQGEDFHTLYKALCEHYRPEDPRRFLASWQALFNKLNSFYTVTETPGEKVFFSLAPLNVVAHQVVSSKPLDELRPERPPRDASHKEIMTYIEQKRQADIKYIHHGFLVSSDVGHQPMITALSQAVNGILDNYGNDILFMPLEQQQEILMRALPDNFPHVSEADTLSFFSSQERPSLWALEKQTLPERKPAIVHPPQQQDTETKNSLSPSR